MEPAIRTIPRPNSSNGAAVKRQRGFSVLFLLCLSNISANLFLSVFPDRYEFKVKPKNELGAGPPSEPVSFKTESGTVPLKSAASRFQHKLSNVFCCQSSTHKPKQLQSVI